MSRGEAWASLLGRRPWREGLPLCRENGRLRAGGDCRAGDIYERAALKTQSPFPQIPSLQKNPQQENNRATQSRAGEGSPLGARRPRSPGPGARSWGRATLGCAVPVRDRMLKM